jgi:hypothetical protein
LLNLTLNRRLLHLWLVLRRLNGRRGLRRCRRLCSVGGLLLLAHPWWDALLRLLRQRGQSRNHE